MLMKFVQIVFKYFKKLIENGYFRKIVFERL